MDFRKSSLVKSYWEESIIPHWQHADRPKGQRFLGSVKIKEGTYEKLFILVNSNFKRIPKITYEALYDEFDDPEKNWLKFFMLTLSEYAYFESQSNSGFWKGFCEKIQITHSSNIENIFRKLVEEGIDLLGLIKSLGGYTHVSTMWIQSGIPHKNLEHFATLLQEIFSLYGWWELAHTPAEDLSQELLLRCTEYHKSWGTLRNFLQISCSDSERENLPISGQLVQGIATIAREIERKSLSLDDLKNGENRKNHLANCFLPQTFFLRNWDSFIQVLETKELSKGSSSRITIHRKKTLILKLDVMDSLDIQLVLPEQNLYKSDWRNFAGNYCKIRELTSQKEIWEGEFSALGILNISSTKSLIVKSIPQQWTFQLWNHCQEIQEEWKFPGAGLNYLIFNAWTGEYIPPSSTPCKVEEIIVYFPTEAHLNCPPSVEILDFKLPSSMKNWEGRHLRLAQQIQADLQLVLPNSTVIISWKLQVEYEPQLKGLTLKGKKSTYLELPTLWIPPKFQGMKLNLSIEDRTHRETLLPLQELCSPNDSWQEVALKGWITHPGSFEVHLWNSNQSWSFCFDIPGKSTFASSAIEDVRFSFYQDTPLIKVPIKVTSSAEFWAQSFTLRDLWPLETVTFLLSTGENPVVYSTQADTSGVLFLEVAILHGIVGEATNYTLDYLRMGLRPSRILELEESDIQLAWNWTEFEVHLSGLQTDQIYNLYFWDVLNPKNIPIKIKIPLVSENSEILKVNLDLTPGLYHIALSGTRLASQSLGYWCRWEAEELAEHLSRDENLENYGYTFLSNKPIKNFLDAYQKLDVDLSMEQVKTLIESTRENTSYLPKWLDQSLLQEKLQALLIVFENLVKQIPMSRVPSTQSDTTHSKQIQQNQKNESKPDTQWYLLRIRRRENFCKIFQVMQSKELAPFEIHLPVGKDYQEIILLKIPKDDLALACDYLNEIGESALRAARPLPKEDVDRFMGKK